MCPLILSVFVSVAFTPSYSSLTIHCSSTVCTCGYITEYIHYSALLYILGYYSALLYTIGLVADLHQGLHKPRPVHQNQ